MITGEGTRRRASGAGRRRATPISRAAARSAVRVAPNGYPQPPPSDEVALVNASIDGSLGAFEELYTRYFPKIRAFCYRKTGNPELAADITQEAFAKAFERIDRFGGPKRFGSWVSTIAANLVTDHYRRKSTGDVPLDAALDGERLPADEIDPLQGVERDQMRRIVRPALDALQPRQREALLLHEIEGLSCAALGQRLGISEVAAESLVARGRRRLRREILAKVKPDELFGAGAGAVAPLAAADRFRPWRRIREAFDRSVSWLQATAARAIEAVGVGPIPTSEAARALVVVLGAAIVIDAAAALQTPSVPAQHARPAVAASKAGTTGASASDTPRIGERVLERAGGRGGVSYDHDSGRTEGTFEGRVGPPGDEGGQPGLDYSVMFSGGPDQGAAAAQVAVKDGSGTALADTGWQSVGW